MTEEIQVDESPDRNLAITLSKLKLGTNSLKYFISIAKKTTSLFHFIIDLTLTSDYISFTAKEALDGKELPKGIKPVDLAKDKPGAAVKYLRTHSQELLQMTCCRVLDSYTTYLADVTREVLISEPNLLKTGEQVKIEYILSFETIDDFIKELAELKVIDLSYKGLMELQKWFSDKMKIAMTEDEAHFRGILEAIETRNIIVHNKALVDRKYLKHVKPVKFKLGESRTLDVDYIYSTLFLIIKSAGLIDDQLVQKYKLETLPID